MLFWCYFQAIGQLVIDLGAAAYHLLAMPAIVNEVASLILDPFVILLIAYLLDVAWGDPKWLYRFLPHPVVIIGEIIGYFERWLNLDSWPPTVRLITGGFTTALVVGILAFAGQGIAHYASGSVEGAILIAIFASTLIASRSLYAAVLDVAEGLRNSLESGRIAVSQIVGRDPETLDAPAISRAAIESLFENFSDGVIAPVFWFAVFGLPGLLAYKAINTLDSMIGHHSDRYEYFGKIAARLDDVANYIPARLSGILLCLAGFVVPGGDGARGLGVMFRQAGGHRSVNAGWPEAAGAGTLDLALAGPRMYDGARVDDPWINPDGLKEVSPVEILRALQLYIAANLIVILVITGAIIIRYMTA
jgi:adenosylcobinamide-phosphate synthase